MQKLREIVGEGISSIRRNGFYRQCSQYFFRTEKRRFFTNSAMIAREYDRLEGVTSSVKKIKVDENSYIALAKWVPNLSTMGGVIGYLCTGEISPLIFVLGGEGFRIAMDFVYEAHMSTEREVLRARTEPRDSVSSTNSVDSGSNHSNNARGEEWKDGRQVWHLESSNYDEESG